MIKGNSFEKLINYFHRDFSKKVFNFSSIAQMIYLVLAAITILYLLNVLIHYSLKRVIYNGKKENNSVNISIIIALRNEEVNVEGLIESLKKLIYPDEKYEVIFVDDNSTDGTYDKLKLKTESINNYSILKSKTSDAAGKRNALSLGILNSKYPYLLITDADCRPDLNWLQAYSNKFTLGYEMLFGIAPFYQKKNFVNKISCFENLRSSLLSFSMASFGLPYTAAARNFGFTKKAFETLDGYSRTKDTLSGDDDLLLREAAKRKMKIGVVTAPDSFVYSDTKTSLNQYLHQKARHTQTSFYYLIKHQFILGFWHILNLSFLFSPLLILFNPLFGILLPSKLLSDYRTVKSNQKKFGYKFSVVEIIYLQFFYEIFLIVHFFNARFFEVKWK